MTLETGDTPIERIQQLPTLPAVARKLTAVLAKPNFTIPEVSSLVRSDPAMAAEVLRLANSAMIGLRYEVMSIMHGISILGTSRLQSLVLTVGMRDFLRGRQGPMMRQCWRHHLATAMVAEELAEDCSVERADAYTAGLLHDLGYMALISAFPAVAESLGETWAGLDADAERGVFGLDHGQAALLLAEQWGLPSTVRAVLEGPADDAMLTMPRVIAIASGLADRIGFAVLPGPVPDRDDKWLAAQLAPAVWANVSRRLGGLFESIPVKINLFECEFGR